MSLAAMGATTIATSQSMKASITIKTDLVANPIARIAIEPVPISPTDAHGTMVSNGTANDRDASAGQVQEEVCDQADNNRNTEVDEGVRNECGHREPTCDVTQFG